MRAVLPDSDKTPVLGELDDPTPGPGEILVAVRATAINRADLLQLRGAYPVPAGESPVPGLECAGVVEEVGDGVDRFQVGDRVMALLGGGGHGELVAVPAGQAMAMPDGMSFEDAAALPESCLTAWVNLGVEGAVQPGETVLVTGANGGVGTVVVQVARELGARVLAIGRDLDRLAPLAELGADGLLVLGDDLADLAREVRERTEGRGADLAIDLVGGDLVPRLLSALRNQGRLVLVGITAGARAELDLAELLRRRLTLRGSVLRSRPREEKAALVEGFEAFARERLADGRIAAVVDRVFPFEEIADAYRAITESGGVGKVVVRMSSMSAVEQRCSIS
jgi:putative PIG3 family NAD(P)H quinone oxidoreductase